MIYHRIAVLGGLLFAGAAALGSTVSAVPARYALLIVCLAGLMTLCFYVAMTLIPSINHARDTGDHQTFDRLHRRNVSLVSAGILTTMAAVDRTGLCFARPVHLLANSGLGSSCARTIAEYEDRCALLTQHSANGILMGRISSPCALQHVGLLLACNVHHNLLGFEQSSQRHADTLVRGRRRIDQQTSSRCRQVEPSL